VLPRPHSAQLTRRIVLTVLICAAFGLITASFRSGGAGTAAQTQVLRIVSPIQRGLSRAWDPIAGAWNWTGDLFHATNENPKLRDQNVQLRVQLHALEGVQAENARYLKELNFEQSTPALDRYTKVNARVTGRIPGSSNTPLVIDVGPDSGVEVNDPVLATGGLIGIVTSVAGSVAVVGLINGNDQNVAAKVTNEDGSVAAGVLQSVSSDGAPALRLTSVNQDTNVEQGSEVVTSGFFDYRTQLGSKYPDGLPIGSVTQVGQSPGDLNKTIQVTPYADFENISDVLVLVSKGAAAAARKLPADASIGTAKTDENSTDLTVAEAQATGADAVASKAAKTKVTPTATPKAGAAG
jgi:rod shape-determining protein MreC